MKSSRTIRCSALREAGELVQFLAKVKLRVRALAIVEAGESAREAARLLNARRAAVPSERFGIDAARCERHKQWLLDLVAREPDLTLEEIRARLRLEKKQKAGIGTIWRFFDRHDITFKKTLRAAERDRPDIAAERAALRAQQPKLDAPSLVFIDETAVT